MFEGVILYILVDTCVENKNKIDEYEDCAGDQSL